MSGENTMAVTRPTMKRLGLFTPYSLEPGGGELYLLSIAAVFQSEFKVFLITPEEQPPDRLEQLAHALDVQIDHVVLIDWKQAKARAPFDVMVVMGNEPLPQVPPLGKKTFYLCQFPFPMDGNELARRRTFWLGYERIIVYSEYARLHLSQALESNSIPEPPIHIIHPPVSSGRGLSKSVARNPGAILSVGRFFSGGHSKRQDELITAFRQVSQRGLSLHLAGTVHLDPKSQAMYEFCRGLARDLPITFYPNATRAELGQLYAQSACYWHGTGLGADRDTQAEKFEHFGITVVEAMASGCIPFALDHGGPASIVTSGQDGWLYRTTAELVDMTLHFLTSTDSDLKDKMRAAARRRARAYRFEVFSNSWKELMAISGDTKRLNISSSPQVSASQNNHGVLAGVLNNFVSSASFQTPDRIDVSAWTEHAPFAFWLIEAMQPKCIVELGVFHGFSYLTMCQAAGRLSEPARCYGIDTWVGDEHAGFYGDDVFQKLKRYHDARYAGFSQLVRQSFDEAVSQFHDGSIDLLHIDGRHFYDDVRHDFEAWRPKLSDRAVVLFHDTNVHERQFGVWRLWEQLASRYPAFEFTHGYGLGVLGYGDRVPNALVQLFASANQNEIADTIRDVYCRLGAVNPERVRYETMVNEFNYIREKLRVGSGPWSV